MFGIGQRKKYNGSVDIKVNNEYQIPTRNNPDFPRMSEYLSKIEEAWSGGLSEDEAALYIACMHYGALLHGNQNEKADTLLARINTIGQFNLHRGIIIKERWEALYEIVEKCQIALMESLAKKPTFPDDSDEMRLVQAFTQIKTDHGFDVQAFPGRYEIEGHYRQLAGRVKLSEFASFSLIYRLVAFYYLADAKNKRARGVLVAKGDLEWTIDLVSQSIDWAAINEELSIVDTLAAQINNDLVILADFFGISRG